MSSRRTLLLTPLLLAGCGFRPLHAPPAPGGAADIAPDLAAIRVGLIPDRSGQIMRQELERRLAGAARGAAGRGAVAARYDLKVTVLVGADLLGFRRDGSPSRVRNTYTAPWTLSTMAVPPVIVAQGSSTAFDAYNVPDNQFFAGLQASAAADRRLLEQLAADVVERVIISLRDRAPG